MNHVDILDRGISLVTGDRREQYGDPKDNMAAIALAATAILGKEIAARDVAVIMTVLKLRRSTQSPRDVDSYVDGAVYFAIAGECSGAK